MQSFSPSWSQALGSVDPSTNARHSSMEIYVIKEDDKKTFSNVNERKRIIQEEYQVEMK
jgi:hypothetical protein